MNIGIIFQNLNHSQQVYNCIKSINEIAEENYLDDYTIFFEHNTQIPIKPLCACMSLYDCWAFNGILILTELSQGYLLKLPLSKKVLYAQNIDWLKMYNYEENYKVYNTVDKLICRSNYHAEAIEKYCHRTPDLIEPHFNLKNIYECLRNN